LIIQFPLSGHVSIAPMMPADAKSNRQHEHHVTMVAGRINAVDQGRTTAGAPPRLTMASFAVRPKTISLLILQPREAPLALLHSPRLSVGALGIG
jgi:hypothetical protein